MKYASMIIAATALALSACGGGDYTVSDGAVADAPHRVTEVKGVTLLAGTSEQVGQSGQTTQTGQMSLLDVSNKNKAIRYPDIGLRMGWGGWPATVTASPYLTVDRTNVAFYDPSKKLIMDVKYKQWTVPATGGGTITMRSYQLFPKSYNGQTFGYDVTMFINTMPDGSTQIIRVDKNGNVTVENNAGSDALGNAIKVIQDNADVPGTQSLDNTTPCVGDNCSGGEVATCGADCVSNLIDVLGQMTASDGSLDGDDPNIAIYSSASVPYVMYNPNDYTQMPMLAPKGAPNQ